MPANVSQFWLDLEPRPDDCWCVPAGIFLPRRDIVYCKGSWPSLRIISGRIRRLAFMNQLQTYNRNVATHWSYPGGGISKERNRESYIRLKQLNKSQLYRPGVPSNSLPDWASVSRCRWDKHCICVHKAIALKFSPSALANSLDVFSQNAYQSDGVFQNVP